MAGYFSYSRTHLAPHLATLKRCTCRMLGRTRYWEERTPKVGTTFTRTRVEGKMAEPGRLGEGKTSVDLAMRVGLRPMQASFLGHYEAVAPFEIDSSVESISLVGRPSRHLPRRGKKKGWRADSRRHITLRQYSLKRTEAGELNSILIRALACRHWGFGASLKAH